MDSPRRILIGAGLAFSTVQRQINLQGTGAAASEAAVPLHAAPTIFDRSSK